MSRPKSVQRRTLGEVAARLTEAQTQTSFLNVLDEFWALWPDTERKLRNDINGLLVQMRWPDE